MPAISGLASARSEIRPASARRDHTLTKSCSPRDSPARFNTMPAPKSARSSNHCTDCVFAHCFKIRSVATATSSTHCAGLSPRRTRSARSNNKSTSKLMSLLSANSAELDNKTLHLCDVKTDDHERSGTSTRLEICKAASHPRSTCSKLGSDSSSPAEICRESPLINIAARIVA